MSDTATSLREIAAQLEALADMGDASEKSPLDLGKLAIDLDTSAVDGFIARLKAGIAAYEGGCAGSNESLSMQADMDALADRLDLAFQGISDLEATATPDSVEARLKALEDQMHALHGDLCGLQGDVINISVTASDLASKEALHQLARDLRKEFTEAAAGAAQEAIKQAVKIAKRDAQAQSLRPRISGDYAR